MKYALGLILVYVIFVFFSSCVDAQGNSESYRNDSLKYWSMYSFADDTANVKSLYPPLQWTPTSSIDYSRAITYDAKTDVLIINRTPAKYTDTFYLVSVTHKDSLKLNKQIDQFKLLGIFGNSRYPGDVWMLFYKNEENNDLLMIEHDYRIGNVGNIGFFRKDSVNYLRGNKHFIEQVVGKHYHYQLNNTYNVVVKGSAGIHPSHFNLVYPDNAKWNRDPDHFVSRKDRTFDLQRFSHETAYPFKVSSRKDGFGLLNGKTVFKTKMEFTNISKAKIVAFRSIAYLKVRFRHHKFLTCFPVPSDPSFLEQPVYHERDFAVGPVIGPPDKRVWNPGQTEKLGFVIPIDGVKAADSLFREMPVVAELVIRLSFAHSRHSSASKHLYYDIMEDWKNYREKIKR